MLIGVSARAASITEEQAKAKARSFLQSRHLMTGGKRLAPARTPAELHITPSGGTALYVFNVGEQDGFVIVSGEDRARPILGYADSGTFDAARIPTALNEMLAIYANQIEQLRNKTTKSDSLARPRRRISGIMGDVAPLLSTTWNQGWPYNDYCPTLEDQTALTGCVATAMAQIANYYEYPRDQVPSLAAYTSPTNKINVSAWGATTFDWDNMLDSYSGGENSTQKAAVATLMRYCGQAAQMDYGFSSGAFNGDALYAFKEKLGYNANATFRSAAGYSINGWEDLIYKEVCEGRPVYYSALNGDEGCDVSGHAFIIDGYKADGNYFHVNWGWGGACDGFFNIFALDPNAPEATVTTTGWHYQMLALIGLSPETVNTAKLTKDAAGSWLITSADDWNELSANLETYCGGSFKLTNDISVATMVGTNSHPFIGTFDGQGNVLDVNIVDNTSGVAPFCVVGTGSTIKNLKIQGTVTSSGYHASGLIGGVSQNEDYTTISIAGCEVAVQVKGTSYAGGFVGHSLNIHPVFVDCIFSGSIHGCYEVGCFVGWKESASKPSFVNCLSIPASVENENSYNFSHPGNGGSEEDATLVNCFYNRSFTFRAAQGGPASSDQLANGSVAHSLQNGFRDWTTGQVWGQQLGTDTTPQLTADTSKGVHKIMFVLDGKVVKTVLSNSPIGNNMPVGEDFGLKNDATFTCNGTVFTSTTTFNSDLTVIVKGTSAYTITLATQENGSISIDNNSCLPGVLKKITANPDDGYVVSAIKVTDATGHELPVTKVSNATNEYVFACPKSSVTVDAGFIVGESEPIRFINGGLTLPSSWRNDEQHWTADTWMIWGDAYNGTDDIIVGIPPVDDLGHQWYEEGYQLTNSDADVLPNGNKIVWENHAASFRDGGNYDYFRETGAEGDRTGDFYIRRIFTFNRETVPNKLYLSCSYDDSPVEYYINGTLVYEDHKSQSYHDGCHEIELTPEQIALIHVDGTPNVLAAHASQNWGGYHLDCGLYDPTSSNYEVIGEQTVRVSSNAFISGDVTIPPTVTSNGVTFTVTELANNAFHGNNSLTSVILPQTLTQIGANAFQDCNNLQYVRSYVPIYQSQTLIAAPASATEFELPMGCSRIHRNAFKFAEHLAKITMPRSLAYIGEKAFVGSKAITDIYAYARPVPQTERNAFEGIDKSSITVHVYASALESYKQAWGDEFKYVTIPDPQPVTLAVNVENAGIIASLIEEGAQEKNSTIYDVQGIIVTGTINNGDLRTLSAMCTGVYNLTSIDLSDATIEGGWIENGVFSDKEKLTSIKLPETLEYIDERAFSGCKGLTSIDIPASVKRLRSYAFDNCPNLITVTGCEGLTELDAYREWYVFGENPNIEGDVYGGTTFLSLDKDATGEYQVPAGIKVIAGGAMCGRNITSVVIPASVTDLGNDVFRGCSLLTDFYVYSTTPPVCYEGSMEYEYDKSMATLHVPASAVEDYKKAKEWCEMGRIVGIVSGELVDMALHVPTAGTLDDNLFETAVAKAQVSDKVLIRDLIVTGKLNYDDITYLNKLPNTLYNMETLDLSGATLENDTVSERLFYSTLYKSIILPENVTNIASEAFRDSRRLKEIKLPASLEVIGSYAFAGTGLTSITIPDNVSEMGDRGLQSCQFLTHIKLGDKLTYVPECWAEYCDNIEEVTIGKNISTIGWRAFRGTNIKHVYSYARQAPSWADSFYDEINADAVLHVHSNCIHRYKNGGGWKNFPSIMGDLGIYPTFDFVVNVETMGTFSEALQSAMTIAGCKNKTDVGKLTVTGNINETDLIYLRDNIGVYLDALDLGAVTVQGNTLGGNALAGCGFEELQLPAKIEKLQGWSVLENCTNLKTINIPNSVKYIGPRTLAAATALECVTGGDGVIDMDGANGMYFDNCPNLKSPVILNHFFYRLPYSTVGAYEVPEHVTAIARDAMWHVPGLTALTLPESITDIYGNAFCKDESLRDIYFYAVELPNTNREAFNEFDRTSCTLHVYEEMVEVFQAEEIWQHFNIVGDLGAMPILTPMNENDYADLCAIYNELDGATWTTKWHVDKNVQSASRWRGVTFDAEGYVTSIDLSNKGLKGDISSLTFSGLTRLVSLNLSSNTITGDILPLAASLPKDCKLNVERQNLGYIGEHTLYELCNYGGLPSIAYYRTQSGTLANTLIGVGNVCQFYHAGTEGGRYWEGRIHADGNTTNDGVFYWQSSAIVECVYPHCFTFTYDYEMGDANMDDNLNVLDLQSTLNYSNSQCWGLFNFYAADTYGTDKDINVQDIVTTVNILLSQEDSGYANARAKVGPADGEACINVENGQIVLYTTKPVAALDMRLTGIAPEDLVWNTEDMGFATVTAARSDMTCAIIYSMQQRQIETGRTVLATFDANFKPHLVSAVLSDKQARSISVGNMIPTGFDQQIGNVFSSWKLTDLSGTCHALGGYATEADILKLAKTRRLHGVFILNADGVKRKIMIK